MKRRDFTMAIQNDIEPFIDLVKQCPQYAYIIHDQDVKTDDNGEIVPVERHVHAYIQFPNPRSFKSVANLLNIEENMVCKIIDKTGLLQYFIHKNQPDKFQYDFNEIVSNFDLDKYFTDKKSNTLWYDFLSLRHGHITPDDFYNTHKNEIDSNAFYQKLRIFEMISAYQDIPPKKNDFPPIHSVLK